MTVLDTIEFLKAVEALLEPLKTILRKESVDPTVIGSFLKTAEKLTIEEDNTNLAKMQVRQKSVLELILAGNFLKN